MASAKSTASAKYLKLLFAAIAVSIICIAYVSHDNVYK